MADRRLLRATAPLRRNHVWIFDFVQARTHDGRPLRVLTLIEEHSLACLALKVPQRINSVGVIEALAEAMCLHGIPEIISCDSGPKMIVKPCTIKSPNLTRRFSTFLRDRIGKTVTARTLMEKHRLNTYAKRSSTR